MLESKKNGSEADMKTCLLAQFSILSVRVLKLNVMQCTTVLVGLLMLQETFKDADSNDGAV